MNSSLEHIFLHYYSPLCNYACKIIGSMEDAEDLVQSLFIQFLQNKNFQIEKVSEAYLLKSVKYKCIDYLRQQKHTVTIDSFNSTPSILPNEITEDEIEPLFYYYAAKLPPKTREVFLLSRVNKLTYKQIAEELNVSQKTVENQMGSALKKLRKIVGKEHFGLLLL